jgi:RHS repeat-associated protein
MLKVMGWYMMKKSMRAGLMTMVFTLSPFMASAQSTLLPPIPLGNAPGAVAVDERRHLAVVADEALPGLYLVDLQSRAVKGTVKLNQVAESVATDPALGLALSVDPQAGTLILTDLTTQGVEATIPVGKQPLAVAVDPLLHLAAVLEEDTGSLHIVDLLARHVARSVKLGAGLVALAIEPSSHQAVVLQEDRLLIVELLTGKLSGTLALPAPGTALAVLPDPAWAVVALQTPAGIVLVDVMSRQVLATLPLVSPAHGVAVHPNTGESLTLDPANQTLLRHDLETRTLIETISLENEPVALAIDPVLNLIVITVKTAAGGALQLVQLPEPPTPPGSPETAGTGASPLITATVGGVPPGPPTPEPFILSLTPPSQTTSPNTTILYTLKLVPTEPGPFPGNATLAISGLPTGVTATFKPPVLGGASLESTLTLQIGTVPAGSYPFTITVAASLGGTTTTKTLAGGLIILTPGITALSGTVLTTEGIPLPNVTIHLGSLSTLTDAGGRFLLLNPPTGEQLVLLDGTTASTATAVYPLIPVKVTILAGQVNPLPYTPYLHAQKTTGFVDISNSAVERVLTDPTLPGFALRIPAGATITGWDGNSNLRVNVTTVPVDKLPIPKPPTQTAPRVYMFYFDKPGGGTPTQPIPVTLPNDLGLPPGEKADLFYFDEAPTLDQATFLWLPAGKGTVSEDGKRIIPDPGTGTPRFCCGSLLYTPYDENSPDDSPDCDNERGDPVDLATGTFRHQRVDLVVPGRIPVRIVRTHRTRDGTLGPFGIGTYLNYDWYVYRYGSGYANARLNLPGNIRFPFSKQADGSYLNTTDPAYLGAVLTFAGDGTATLRLKDGMTYGFNTRGLLVSQADRYGNRLTFVREEAGNIGRILDGSGRTLVTFTVISIYSRVYVSKITDFTGREVTYTYDTAIYPLARLRQVTYPDGAGLRYAYEFNPYFITTITNARGVREVLNEFDIYGRVVRQTHADGGVYTYSYALDAQGRVTQTVMRDPRGATLTRVFNQSLYGTQETDALGNTTTYERDAANLLRAITDPLGRRSTFTYDAKGNRLTQTDPAGNTTTYTYEPTFSQVTSVTNALGQVTRYAYDPQGNLTQITDPLGAVTQIGYNATGQPLSVTDPLGSTTRFEYDALGNLTATVDPLGNRTTRTYDAIGRLASLTDPLGRTTSYAYDLWDRLTAVTDPAGGVTAYGYDPNGNLTTVTDAKGQTLAFTYTVRDKLASFTDGLGRRETYQYDGMDNLVSVTDRKGQATTFTYDAANRRIGATYGDGSTTTYTYDAVSRVTEIADSVGGFIRYAYGTFGCAQGCAGGAGDRVVLEQTPLGSIAYTYDALGRRTSMTVAGQPTVNYQYDAAGRLTGVQQGGQTVNLGYDATGRRTGLTLPNGVQTTYTHDTASRHQQILHAKAGNPLEDIRYQNDASGNRTAYTRNAGHPPLPTEIQATFNAANQMVSLNDKMFSYDLNGNLTAIQPSGQPATQYTWDARNRLTGIAGPGLTASFKYDALGRRVEKTINGQTMQYLYDGLDIVAELQNSAVTATYLRSLNIDEPFSRTKGGSTSYYLQDALGSVVGLADSTGALATTYSYDAFGAVTRSGVASDQPFTYTGREDDGIGLYYYRARYYSPEMRRFISEDPIRPTVGINKFWYVMNKPINYRDSMGLIDPNMPNTPPPPKYLECIEEYKEAHFAEVAKLIEEREKCIKMCDTLFRKRICSSEYMVFMCKVSCAVDFHVKGTESAARFQWHLYRCYLLYWKGAYE